MYQLPDALLNRPVACSRPAGGVQSDASPFIATGSGAKGSRGDVDSDAGPCKSGITRRSLTMSVQVTVLAPACA